MMTLDWGGRVKEAKCEPDRRALDGEHGRLQVLNGVLLHSCPDGIVIV
jgi:hypothetical protein